MPLHLYDILGVDVDGWVSKKVNRPKRPATRRTGDMAVNASSVEYQ